MFKGLVKFLELLQDMNINDIVAWWGAIVATLILIWDVYKWKRSGPMLKVTARPNMRSMEKNSEGVYIIVEVSNIGDKSTTLTHLVGVCYKSRLAMFHRKPNYSFFVPNTMSTNPLPFLLIPGDHWMGGIDQRNLEKEFKEKSIKNISYLYCGVNDSSKSKPALVRVKLK